MSFARLPQTLAILVAFASFLGGASSLGLAPEATSSRIVGAARTHIGLFPFEVSLRRKHCEICAYVHYCGGSIYRDDIIITAASCVRPGGGATLPPMLAVVGSTFRTGAALDGAVYPIPNIRRHEDAAIDVALIRLALPIALNNFTTQPVTLGTRMPHAGQLAVVAGWGQERETAAYTEQLHAVHVPIVDLEACRRLYAWLKNVSEHELCAGFTAGGAADACQGDAGSPLLVDQQMVGIVSWGYGCGRANSPGVYTNVVALRDWIERNADELSARKA